MGRGLAKKTLSLIAIVTPIIESRKPITVRGVAYQLFNRKLLPDMSKKSVASVSRLLTTAREHDLIPWDWIVDETRDIAYVPSWSNPTRLLRAVGQQYRKDLWQQQPERVFVVSEKATVGGILRPILDQYGVPFAVYHGFGSATALHDLADISADDDRPLTVVYVGDHDPSGRNMSDVDLPNRIDRYGGLINIERIAILPEQIRDYRLLTFSAHEKKDDPRYPWFLKTHGDVCCELDALDPNTIRELVSDAIASHIDWDAWDRATSTEAAELTSLRDFLASWEELGS